jgi:hypothetical protein
MDWNDYQDRRESFVIEYRNTVLVAYVAQPNQEMVLFGPFANGEVALDWMETVPSGVRVSFLPVRRPDIARKNIDFFQPSRFVDKSEFDRSGTVLHPHDSMTVTTKEQK